MIIDYIGKLRIKSTLLIFLNKYVRFFFVNNEIRLLRDDQQANVEMKNTIILFTIGKTESIQGKLKYKKNNQPFTKRGRFTERNISSLKLSQSIQPDERNTIVDSNDLQISFNFQQIPTAN